MQLVCLEFGAPENGQDAGLLNSFSRTLGPGHKPIRFASDLRLLERSAAKCT